MHVAHFHARPTKSQPGTLRRMWVRLPVLVIAVAAVVTTAAFQLGSFRPTQGPLEAKTTTAPTKPRWLSQLKLPAFHHSKMGNTARVGQRTRATEFAAPEGTSQQQQRQAEWSLSSFNLLCPTYKRIDKTGRRESSDIKMYTSRLKGIIELLRESKSDIYALQEYWSESEEAQRIFANALKDDLKGYRVLALRRTSHWSPRDDAVAFLVGPRIQILDVHEILFQDCGDRVAFMILATVDGVNPVLIVNTHLLFPHNPYSTQIRLREVRKTLCYVHSYLYRQENPLSIPVVVCGDFNGSPDGNVARYMQEQGFNLMCGAKKTDDHNKLPGWVSHRSHRGNTLPCDLIWVLNPSDAPKLFKPQDWKDRVFSEIDERIVERNLTLSESFKRFFDQDSNNLVDPEEFRAALIELGFQGEGSPHLLDIEIEQLLQSADTDGSGNIDYKEFIDRFWRATQDDSLLLGLSEPGSGDGIYKVNRQQVRLEKASSEASSVGDLGQSMKRSEADADVMDVQFLRGKETYSLAAGEEGTIKRLDRLAEIGVSCDNQDAGFWDIEPVNFGLYPKLLEEGIWPDDWDLSDHGMVTTKFKPKRADYQVGKIEKEGVENSKFVR